MPLAHDAARLPGHATDCAARIATRGSTRDVAIHLGGEWKVLREAETRHRTLLSQADQMLSHAEGKLSYERMQSSQLQAALQQLGAVASEASFAVQAAQASEGRVRHVAERAAVGCELLLCELQLAEKCIQTQWDEITSLSHELCELHRALERERATSAEQAAGRAAADKDLRALREENEALRLELAEGAVRSRRMLQQRQERERQLAVMLAEKQRLSALLSKKDSQARQLEYVLKKRSATSPSSRSVAKAVQCCGIDGCNTAPAAEELVEPNFTPAPQGIEKSRAAYVAEAPAEPTFASESQTIQGNRAALAAEAPAQSTEIPVPRSMEGNRAAPAAEASAQPTATPSPCGAKARSGAPAAGEFAQPSVTPAPDGMEECSTMPGTEASAEATVTPARHVIQSTEKAGEAPDKPDVDVTPVLATPGTKRFIPAAKGQWKKQCEALVSPSLPGVQRRFEGWRDATPANRSAALKSENAMLLALLTERDEALRSAQKEKEQLMQANAELRVKWREARRALTVKRKGDTEC